MARIRTALIGSSRRPRRQLVLPLRQFIDTYPIVVRERDFTLALVAGFPQGLENGGQGSRNDGRTT